MQEFSKILDDNHGCMAKELENEFQQQLFKANKNESFEGYFKALGINIEGGEKGVYEKLI